MLELPDLSRYLPAALAVVGAAAAASRAMWRQLPYGNGETDGDGHRRWFRAGVAESFGLLERSMGQRRIGFAARVERILQFHGSPPLSSAYWPEQPPRMGSHRKGVRRRARRP